MLVDIGEFPLLTEKREFLFLDLDARDLSRQPGEIATKVGRPVEEPTFRERFLQSLIIVRERRINWKTQHLLKFFESNVRAFRQTVQDQPELRTSISRFGQKLDQLFGLVQGRN